MSEPLLSNKIEVEFPATIQTERANSGDETPYVM